MPETPSSPPLNTVPDDDWDHSLPDTKENAATIVFPAPAELYTKNATAENGKGNPSLSKLLRLHSEKDFTAEEAARIADLLGQWINASSSPYEAEDDFFVPSGKSMDDLSITLKRPSQDDFGCGRPRGRSECTNSPSSSANFKPS